MVAIIYFPIIGFVVGLFGNQLMKRTRFGLPGSIVPGVVGGTGAFLGGWVMSLLGIGGLIQMLIFAIVGAVILLIVAGLLLGSGDYEKPASFDQGIPTNQDSKSGTVKPGQKPIRTSASVPDQQPKKQESSRIFISYRRDDSADIAGRIYDRLVQHFQMEHVFKDVDSIPLGVDFLHHLEEAVAKCNFFLLIIGPEWIHGGKADTKNLLRNSTDFVRIEAESALKQGIPVIPLFVRKAIMPPAEDLPESLKPLVYRNGISIRPDPDFHNDLDRLIKAIETHPRQKTGT